MPPIPRKRPPRSRFGRRAAAAPGPGGAADEGESAGDSLAAAEQLAYGLLARRDYAVAELAARLAERGLDPARVAALTASFLERGYLDDERFASHFVAAHAARGQGPLRIRRELEDRGVSSAVAEAAIRAGPDWGGQARDLRRRRFGADPPADWPEKARQLRFLQYRGFSPDHIRSALEAPDLDLDATP